MRTLSILGPPPASKRKRQLEPVVRRGIQMTAVAPAGEARTGLRSSQLGWAILVVTALQALIFASCGAWIGTCSPQCGSSYPELGFGFFGAGAVLFFVGLRASQGRRVSSAIALLDRGHLSGHPRHGNGELAWVCGCAESSILDRCWPRGSCRSAAGRLLVPDKPHAASSWMDRCDHPRVRGLERDLVALCGHRPIQQGLVINVPTTPAGVARSGPRIS
jgi:hypothetical protein